MQMQMFARISKHRKAMGSGPRDSGLGTLGPRMQDPLQSLKVELQDSLQKLKMGPL